MATLLKKLTLQLGADQFECQLTTAEVTDEPTTEEFQSFCGTETFASSAYKLHLAGAQDWTDVDGICAIIHEAYVSEPVAEIAFEVALGEPPSKWRSGQCKPTADVPFGGVAGSPLTFDQTLDVIGVPDEIALTP
jgi:hypothetical protein